MLFFRKTAVRSKRNLMGKAIRGRLSLADVLAMELAGVPRAEFLDLLDRGYLLPWAGATTNRNQQASSVATYFPKAIVVSTDQTIHQADMVWWDPVNYTLKPLTTAAQVAVGNTGGFCGCAAGSNVPGVYPNPAAGTPSENLAGIEVQHGGSVYLTLQANDVVDGPFTALTAAGVDAQTVTRGGATSTNRVGFAIVPLPTTPRGAPGATPAPETVAGGSTIEVWLEAKFPSTITV